MTFAETQALHAAQPGNEEADDELERFPVGVLEEALAILEQRESRPKR